MQKTKKITAALLICALFTGMISVKTMAAESVTVKLEVNTYSSDDFAGGTFTADDETLTLTGSGSSSKLESEIATSAKNIAVSVDTPNNFNVSVKYSGIDFYVVCMGRYNAEDTPTDVNDIVNDFSTKGDVSSAKIPVDYNGRTLEGIWVTFRKDSMGDALIPDTTARYKIKYDPNGGEFTIFDHLTEDLGGEVRSKKVIVDVSKEGDKPLKYMFTSGSDYRDISREGYKFLGWTTKKNDKSTKVSKKFKVNKKLTLYALWKKDKKLSKSDKEKPDVPVIDVSVVDGCARIGWSGVADDDHCEISYSIDGGKTYKVYKSYAEKFDHDYTYALKSGTTYMFRARSYKIVKSTRIYSDYSEAVSLEY